MHWFIVRHAADGRIATHQGKVLVIQAHTAKSAKHQAKRQLPGRVTVHEFKAPQPPISSPEPRA